MTIDDESKNENTVVVAQVSTPTIKPEQPIVSTSTSTLNSKKRNVILIIVAGLSAVILGPIAILSKSILLGIVALVIVIVSSIISTRLNKKQTTTQNETMASFASQYGLSYQANPSPDLVRGLFKMRVKLNHLTSGNGGDFFMLMIQYEGRDGPGTIFASIRRVAYPKIKTTLFLLPKSYGPVELRQTSYFNLVNLYAYSFEGQEINQYYNCYLLKGEEVDDLTFLSPDNLVWLESNYGQYPIILMNGYLYIFSKGGNPTFTDTASYKSQYDTTKSVADYLVAKAV